MLFCVRAAELMSAPGVEVCIKVQHRDWAIYVIQCAEDRQDDGMVTTKG